MLPSRRLNKVSSGDFSQVIFIIYDCGEDYYTQVPLVSSNPHLCRGFANKNILSETFEKRAFKARRRRPTSFIYYSSFEREEEHGDDSTPRLRIIYTIIQTIVHFILNSMYILFI